MRALICTLLTVTLGATAACSAGSAADGNPHPSEATEADEALVATATTAQVEVFGDPEGTDLVTTLDAPADYPLVLAVIERRDDMIEAQLPVRPNDASGWVREADVELSTTEYRIDIDLDDHRLVLYDADGPVMDETVVIGTADNPTPTESFYVVELLQPEQPDGPYGPFAFGLSGHSEKLTEFAGGDGRVGIHGTDQPELLGSDASHGCIRLHNDAITRLAELVPLGTPVHIYE